MMKYFSGKLSVYSPCKCKTTTLKIFNKYKYRECHIHLIKKNNPVVSTFYDDKSSMLFSSTRSWLHCPYACRVKIDCKEIQITSSLSIKNVRK